MEWIPIALVTFKVLVLSVGSFLAIKWHYDQGKKEKDKEKERRAVLLATGKVAAVFSLLLLGLLYITFAFLRMLGTDVSIP